MSENPDVWESVTPAEAPELPADYEPAPEGSAPEVPDAPEHGPAPMRAILAADAKNRSGRSALQSTGVMALASVCGVAATYLHDGDLSHLDWKAFALAALVAGGQPVASYVHRMLGK